MATLALNIQTCNVSPKRLIHLFIFMLISFKFCLFQLSAPYIKRCYERYLGWSYLGLIPIQNITDFRDCLHYCEHELPSCDLVSIVKIPGQARCNVKNNTDPLDTALFWAHETVYIFFVDLKCSRNVTPCWIMRGNLFHKGLQHFNDSNGTLESCMNRCIHEYPLCDAINYRNPKFEGGGCWVKTHAGPLDKFRALDSVSSHVLNRTCLEIELQTATTTVSVTAHQSAMTRDSAKSTSPDSATAHKSVEENQTNPAENHDLTNPAGSHDSSNDSFLEKYYVYFLAVAGILLLTVVVIVVKHYKRGGTSGVSSASSETA